MSDEQIEQPKANCRVMPGQTLSGYYVGGGQYEAGDEVELPISVAEFYADGGVVEIIKATKTASSKPPAANPKPAPTP